MAIHIHQTECILYVNDQKVSTLFYQKLFRKQADLDVPGMTSFVISPTCTLGLMPNQSIAKILGNKTPHPETGTRIPRCELYFHVQDAAAEFQHALQCGAQMISPLMDRDWGDKVCYFADPDGHVIAFAEKIS